MSIVFKFRLIKKYRIRTKIIMQLRCSVSSAVDSAGRNADFLFKAEMNAENGCDLILAR